MSEQATIWGVIHTLEKYPVEEAKSLLFTMLKEFEKSTKVATLQKCIDDLSKGQITTFHSRVLLTTPLPNLSRTGDIETPTGVTWRIQHPGTMQWVDCDSFEDGMARWFEGFNPPHKMLDGVDEGCDAAHARVKAHYAAKP